MIGLDTNILARYFTQDDPAQAAKAGRLIKKCTRQNPGYINLIVLAELFWLLSQRYKYKKEQLADLLRNLLQLEDLTIEAADDVYRAMKYFETGKLQLADCLIAVRNQQAGCTTTHTFDKTAAKSPGFTGIK